MKHWEASRDPVSDDDFVPSRWARGTSVALAYSEAPRRPWVIVPSEPVAVAPRHDVRARLTRPDAKG